MKIDLIKQDIKRIALSKGLIALVLLVILWGADYYNSSTTENLLNVQNSFAGLDSALVNKIAVYDEAQENMKKYLDISSLKIPAKERYNLGFVRLRAMVPEFDKLKAAYFFKSLDYTVGDIKPNTKFFGTDMEIYENSLLLNFSGATDETVFSIINDLKKVLPGYILLKSLEVIKTQPVTEITANNYLTRPDFAFVNGRIELKWIVIQRANLDQQPQPQ